MQSLVILLLMQLHQHGCAESDVESVEHEFIDNAVEGRTIEIVGTTLGR